MPMFFLQAIVATAMPSPPADWRALPELIVNPTDSRIVPPTDYVRAQVDAGHCSAAVATSEGTSLTVDVAVLLAADGGVRRVVPRAIGCPTIEQYASGLASRIARRAIVAPVSDAWFRTTIDFEW